MSCIYGIGAPETYHEMSFALEIGQALSRKKLLDSFTEIQYERREDDFKRGSFRVRGDVVEIFPSYEDFAYRIELEDGRIKALSAVDPLLGKTLDTFDRIMIHPRTFFSTPREVLKAAADGIEEELAEPGGQSSGPKASSSRPNGSRNGPSTTWTCSGNSAIARASRTTRSTYPAGSPASRRSPSSTTSRRTS